MTVLSTIDHPLYNPLAYEFETPAITSLHEKLLRWVWLGETGGLISGDARVGKSTAIRYLSNKIYNRQNQTLPTHFFTVPKRDRHTTRAIFCNLCLSAGLKVNKASTSDSLQDDFFSYLLEKFVEFNCFQCLLFVDEAQRLSLEQFEAFSELYDNFVALKLNLIVIFIANKDKFQPILNAIEANDTENDESHIYGRFFTEQTEFKGICSKADLSLCLKQYDTLRYPDQGPSFTQFFLPDDFTKGWRLEKIADVYWRCFKEVSKEMRLKHWPMKFFTKATNMLLIDWLPRIGVSNFGEDVALKCIKDSRLASYRFRRGH